MNDGQGKGRRTGDSLQWMKRSGGGRLQMTQPGVGFKGARVRT